MVVISKDLNGMNMAAHFAMALERLKKEDFTALTSFTMDEPISEQKLEAVVEKKEEIKEILPAVEEKGKEKIMEEIKEQPEKNK